MKWSKAMWMLLVTVIIGVAVLAAETKGVKKNAAAKPKWTGSIKVNGKRTQADLARMAKISKADAEKAALKAVKTNGANARVAEVELAMKNGYLVYEVEVKVNGQKGETEVIVDAGTGKVLAVQHEDDDDDDDDNGNNGNNAKSGKK